MCFYFSDCSIVRETLRAESAVKMKPSDTCSVPDTNTTLQNLWAVVSDEHAAGQLERHLILLETYLTMTGASVWLHDLRLLMKVTSFLADKIEREKSYREHFHRILAILKQPFKMEKASDEINFKNYIVEFFTTLGCLLLQSKSKDTKSDVLEIVEGILYTERVKRSNMVPVRACISGIEVSEFMECLADFIVLADGDLYQWVIYTALQISSMSHLSCWTLLTRGVVESLLVRLTAVGEEEKDEVLDTTYHMLWRVLSCTTHPQDWSRVSAPSLLALRILRYVLREEALTHAHPGHYNNSLNNISALTLKLMQLFPTAEYVHSGLIEDITFLATLTETSISIHILPRFKNTVDHLQFKKLMLACLSTSPISTLSIKIFEEYKVADCLVAMMSSERAPSGLTVLWTPEQMLELFQCALPVVCTLFDPLHKHFIDAGLMRTLIGFLEVHYFIEKHLPDDLALTVLRTVTSLCFRKNNCKVIRDALRKADAVLTLLNLCQTVLEQALPLTLCTQTTLCHSLTTLAALMENEVGLQTLHAKICINIVDSLYQRVLKPLSTDSLIDNRLIVSVSNFAWEALVWNKENSLMLLKSGIVYSHIDILEKSTFSVQTVYLSMLTDLSEYEQCVPYLISWRGRGGVKLLSLLCRIWRAEENRLQVSRNENGCISDIENPLMGKSQAEFMKIECKKSVSVYDVYGSVRPKIYAIVQLLHRHREVTEISEEHYKLGHDKLPCEDLITMRIIEAYLPLKMGEIWWEIRNKQEKVLPLDRYLAETLADRYLNWSLSIQCSQYEILKSFETQERDKEYELYSLLGADRLTSALAALREVEMIARTTDRQQQLRTYQRLCQGIENSRAYVVSDLRVTYPQGLSVVLVSSKTDVLLCRPSDSQ